MNSDGSNRATCDRQGEHRPGCQCAVWADGSGSAPDEFDRLMGGYPKVDESESAPQTAMLLTQAEWDDLETMTAHYAICMSAYPPEGFDRLRRLATRIAEANR